MDSRVLKYFLTVAQVGNITKAAHILSITQPTLSRQMMALEEEVGSQLLIRGRRELRLTNNGLIFQQRAREILSLIEKTEQDISTDDQQITGTISIGCVESSISKSLAKLIVAFSKKYPLVKYNIYDANGDDIKEKLDWGHIDLGIVLEPVEMAKYDYEPLYQGERWGITVKKDSPLASASYINHNQLANKPLLVSGRLIVVEEIMSWFDVPKDQLNIIQTHNLLSNSIPYVEIEFGTIITIEGAYDLVNHDHITFVPFQPEKISNHVLIWKKKKVFSEATELFMQFINEHKAEFFLQ